MSNINLRKQEKINLKKTNGGELQNVRLGLGWDEAKKGGFLSKLTSAAIDLDASALMLSADRRVIDSISFMHLTSNDGSIQHMGDNLTGRGDGDDESILVKLTAIDQNVQKIVFTVSSFNGQNFNRVENAFVRIVDSDNRDEELARYSLSSMGDHSALIMAELEREGNGEWSFKALGEPCNGRTINDLTGFIQSM